MPASTLEATNTTYVTPKNINLDPSIINQARTTLASHLSAPFVQLLYLTPVRNASTGDSVSTTTGVQQRRLTLKQLGQPIAKDILRLN